MTDDQITSLAREYAEEIYPHEEGEDLGQMSFLRNNAIKHIGSTLKMLLRRFCLVEKSKIRQIYQAKQHILANQDVFGMTGATEAAAQKRLILCLFPEIGKEVEG